MAQRRGGKRISVHAGCWKHRIVISKDPPPTTLTPVAEKMLTLAWLVGKSVWRGQRGKKGEREGEMSDPHPEKLQTKTAEVETFSVLLLERKSHTQTHAATRVQTRSCQGETGQTKKC